MQVVRGAGPAFGCAARGAKPEEGDRREVKERKKAYYQTVKNKNGRSGQKGVNLRAATSTSKR